MDSKRKKTSKMKNILMIRDSILNHEYHFARVFAFALWWWWWWEWSWKVFGFAPLSNNKVLIDLNLES